MEVKQKIVKVLYWDCGIDAHRHKTKAVAERCVEKNKDRIKRNIPLERLESKLKKIRAAKAVIKGRTYNSVGKSFGVTGSRIRDYIQLAIRISHHPSKGLINDDSIISDEPKVMRENAKEFLDRMDKLEDILLNEYKEVNDG